MNDSDLSNALERVARDILEALPDAERLAELLTDLAAVYQASEHRTRLLRAVARGAMGGVR